MTSCRASSSDCTVRFSLLRTKTRSCSLSSSRRTFFMLSQPTPWPSSTLCTTSFRNCWFSLWVGESTHHFWGQRLLGRASPTFTRLDVCRRGQKLEATFQSTRSPAKPTPPDGWVCPRTQYWPHPPPHHQQRLPHGGRVRVGRGFTSLSLFSTPQVWYRNRYLHLRTFQTALGTSGACPMQGAQV